MSTEILHVDAMILDVYGGYIGGGGSARARGVRYKAYKVIILIAPQHALTSRRTSNCKYVDVGPT
jgi:hypothetical protein